MTQALKKTKAKPANNDRSKPRQSDSLTPFCFYQALNYPIPLDHSTFAYLAPFPKKEKKADSFSRSSPNPHLNSFLSFIEKRKRLFPQLPFIKAVYLANSITFNALNPSSDIDLFIITKANRIWLARAFTSLTMRLFQIKRSQSSSAKKFCLSFFISENHQNLETLLLDEKDLYLPYRIAHLVPIYQASNGKKEKKADFFEQNLRVKNFLPNRTPQQHIQLGISCQQGSGLFKKCLEILVFGNWGTFRENILAKFRSKSIERKKRKNPDLHHGVITSSTILKFHHDRRSEYSKKIFG